ncbi:LysR family transcriptional regulator [Leptolyngbya sp. NK1-12]|uniref:LysR family transcriptional regulator n=1 Tax=Leptolyngbya sp. NK1-12 TaxID=2547451 RepID=A0AA96WEW1_9CYAN|nr:LysR family transcriptional regulator [Leptolyngbya sp. NK1-12]WNZ23914.1 LysR family transcriptional regulator [Leptolyngbya sp. NK1-12]
MATIHGSDSSKVKLFQLRAFVAVADCKQFGEAALQLGLTQSSVSHAIASLEAELGVQLLHRGRRGAMLTPTGEQLLPEARQILQLLDTLLHKAQLARGLSTGQVRLASLRSIATYLLPHVIASFRQQFPEIKVTLTQYFYNAEIQAALRQGSADIGFMELPVSEEFATYDLVADEYVVLLPPAELPFKMPSSMPSKQPLLTWQQLSSYPLIMPAPNYEGSIALQQHLQTHAPFLHIGYEINEDSIQVAMVQQGLGAAILPHLAAMPIPSEIPVYPLPTPLRRRLGAVLRVADLHSPATFAFWDLLQIK